MPAVWDETRLVAGDPGDHAVFARRNGQDWFVGGMSGEDAYRMQLPEELLIGILKGGIKLGMLPRPTRHLSSQPCEVIELLLEAPLDGIERLLLCLIELIKGLLVDILGPFQDFFLALDQVS